MNRPHINVAGFRDDHAKNMIRGAIRAFSEGTEDEIDMPGTAVFYILNGGQHNVQSCVSKCFRDDTGNILKTKDVRTLFVSSTEASKKERFSRLRLGASLSLMEMAWVYFNPQKVELTCKSRATCEGSTLTDHLGPFNVPSLEGPDTFRVMQSKRKSLYGTAYATGGAGLGRKTTH